MSVPQRHSRWHYSPGAIGGITGTPSGGGVKAVGMVIPFTEDTPFDSLLDTSFPCMVSVTAGMQLSGSGFSRTDNVRCDMGITLTQGAISAPSRLIAADSKVFFLTQPRFRMAFNASGIAAGPVAVWAFGRVLDDDVTMDSLTLEIAEPELGRVGYGGYFPEGAGVTMDVVQLDNPDPVDPPIGGASAGQVSAASAPLSGIMRLK